MRSSLRLAGWLLAATAGLCLAGCGGGSGGGQAGPLQYVVTLDKPTYRAGEPVGYTYTITNSSDQAVTLRSSLLYTWDNQLVGTTFTVYRGTEQPIYRHINIEPNGEVTIPAHSSVSAHEAWDQTDDYGNRVTPGRYLLVIGVDSMFPLPGGDPAERNAIATIR